MADEDTPITLVGPILVGFQLEAIEQGLTVRSVEQEFTVGEVFVSD